MDFSRDLRQLSCSNIEILQIDLPGKFDHISDAHHDHLLFHVGLVRVVKASCCDFDQTCWRRGLGCLLVCSEDFVGGRAERILAMDGIIAGGKGIHVECVWDPVRIVATFDNVIDCAQLRHTPLELA